MDFRGLWLIRRVSPKEDPFKTAERIEMKICTGVDLGEIIMDVKFKFEKFTDFDVIGGHNSPFSIDFARGPHHSAALPRSL